MILTRQRSTNSTLNLHKHYIGWTDGNFLPDTGFGRLTGT